MILKWCIEFHFGINCFYSLVLRLASGKQVKRSSWKWNIITNKRKHAAFFLYVAHFFSFGKMLFWRQMYTSQNQIFESPFNRESRIVNLNLHIFYRQKIFIIPLRIYNFPEANFCFDIEKWIIPNCKVFGPKYYRMHILKTFSSIVLTPKLLYMLSKFHFISAFGANIGGKSFHIKSFDI